MTDGAVLATIGRTAGSSLPAAASPARAVYGATPDTESAAPRQDRQDRQEETNKPAGPVRPRQTPLLNTESQLTAQQAGGRTGDRTDTPESQPAGEGETAGAVTDPSNPENLSDEDQKKVAALQQRDREVRAHEQAHKAAGGAYAGSPSFETVRGPDGNTYAVGGEVRIDTSPVPDNPEATIRKLEQVKRAALAPATPSGQDHRVAAEADAKIQAARQQKHEKETEELKKAQEKSGGEADPTSPESAADGNTPAPTSDAPATAGGATSTVSPGSLFDLVA